MQIPISSIRNSSILSNKYLSFSLNDIWNLFDIGLNCVIKSLIVVYKYLGGIYFWDLVTPWIAVLHRERWKMQLNLFHIKKWFSWWFDVLRTSNWTTSNNLVYESIQFLSHNFDKTVCSYLAFNTFDLHTDTRMSWTLTKAFYSLFDALSTICITKCWLEGK